MAAITTYEPQYKVLKVGTLKYDRLTSILLLKQTFRNYSYNYSYKDVKEIFDSILNNEFEEEFDLTVKLVLDTVFDNMEYTTINDYPSEYSDYKTFMYIDESTCSCDNCDVIKKCARLYTLSRHVLVICKDCLQEIINQFE